MALSQTSPVSLTHLLDYGRIKATNTNGVANSPPPKATAADSFSARCSETPMLILTGRRFHTGADLRANVDHVVPCSLPRVWFPFRKRSTFLFGSFFFLPHHKVSKTWKLGAGHCIVRRVLLVQGKAAVAAVILLIFLIWANVGGEVKQ